MSRLPRYRVVACCWSLTSFLLGSCGDGNGPPNDPPTLVAAFEGVIGGEDGVETGTIALNFMSDNSGDGTFTPTGGVALALDNVLVNGSNFTASGGGVTVSGSFTTDDLSGTYNKTSGGGLVAALKKVTGITFTSFCATHTGSSGDGVYSFVWDPASHKLHGVWSTVGAVFQGIISGEDAQTGGAGATMTGNTGTVTILPAVGPPATLGGFYDLNGSSVNGSMGGTSCP